MPLLTDDLLKCIEHLRIHINKVQEELERMRQYLAQEAERERSEKDKEEK